MTLVMKGQTRIREEQSRIWIYVDVHTLTRLPMVSVRTRYDPLIRLFDGFPNWAWSISEFSDLLILITPMPEPEPEPEHMLVTITLVTIMIIPARAT
jgi:hypothetical protein